MGPAGHPGKNPTHLAFKQLSLRGYSELTGQPVHRYGSVHASRSVGDVSGAAGIVSGALRGGAPGASPGKKSHFPPKIDIGRGSTFETFCVVRYYLVYTGAPLTFGDTM